MITYEDIKTMFEANRGDAGESEEDYLAYISEVLDLDQNGALDFALEWAQSTAPLFIADYNEYSDVKQFFATVLSAAFMRGLQIGIQLGKSQPLEKLVE